MNRLHRWYCKSDHWRRTVTNEILPWALSGITLREPILEVGPGPGVTTDWLRRHVNRIDCLEIDSALADALQIRFRATGVRVRCGDATAMPYEDCSFNSVVSFTMLHHILTAELQDRFFSEVLRVLQPGGIFAGVDSLPSMLMSFFHIRDTLTLVAPDTLSQRLTATGFTDAQVDVSSSRFRFSAKRTIDPAHQMPLNSGVATAEYLISRPRA